MIKILGLIFLFLNSYFILPLSGITAEPGSPGPQDIGIDSQVGQQISLDLLFKDEKGQMVALKDYFDGKTPVILTLVYYGCPDLCTLVVNHLTQTMKKSRWTVGDHFKIVTLSINPNETPELAAQKKESYLRNYNRSEAQKGWHFLTGLHADIRELSNQVGFHFQYVEETGEYAHAAGIFILSPGGKLVRILHGNHYSPRDLKGALMEASEGKMGSIVDRLLMPLAGFF